MMDNNEKLVSILANAHLKSLDYMLQDFEKSLTRLNQYSEVTTKKVKNLRIKFSKAYPEPENLRFLTKKTLQAIKFNNRVLVSFEELSRDISKNSKGIVDEIATLQKLKTINPKLLNEFIKKKNEYNMLQDKIKAFSKDLKVLTTELSTFIDDLKTPLKPSLKRAIESKTQSTQSKPQSKFQPKSRTKPQPKLTVTTPVKTALKAPVKPPDLKSKHPGSSRK